MILLVSMSMVRLVQFEIITQNFPPLWSCTPQMPVNYNVLYKILAEGYPPSAGFFKCSWVLRRLPTKTARVEGWNWGIKGRSMKFFPSTYCFPFLWSNAKTENVMDIGKFASIFHFFVIKSKCQFLPKLILSLMHFCLHLTFVIPILLLYSRFIQWDILISNTN